MALLQGVMKMIDIVKVRTECKNGRLKAFVKKNIYGEDIIYLKDTQNGETVQIGIVEKEEKGVS